MAKAKLKERYRPSDRMRNGIMKKLMTKPEKGPVPITVIMPVSDNCPICGSGPEFVWDKDKTGKKTKREVRPYKVDHVMATFRCSECSFQGSPVNYLMITRKITHEEAMNYLRKELGA